ncbi:VanZ family protein [Nonomuraea sp. NPDC059023]|uniref:VanZ family protein n=1 Tax=unclassified Nonomuraea TaxID=2593643 RepID=UPI0036780F4F
MTEIFTMWGNVIIATFLTVPAAALAIFHLTRGRARRAHPAPLRSAVADVGIVIGTAPWIWMILTPSGRRNTVELVPFQVLIDLAAGPWETAFVQVGGNLLVFAALGGLLPVRSARFTSLARIALIAALASMTVESLQYGLRLGRDSATDDVLVNTAGAVLAAVITRRWWAPVIPGRTVPR